MKALSRYAAALCAVVLVVGHGAGSENKSEFSRRTPIVEAVQKTQSSIVTVKVPRSGLKDLIGTGVIVDERGYIITNRHVVGASRHVGIVLNDKTELKGEVVMGDAGTDLAIVRVQAAKKLQVLKPAPVSDLMVGETVIAVGHPFGYTNTVSTGIVSALGREIRMPTGDTLTGLIQTNASINPGNSGGPLLNINGELIGINVALREGAQGIAFAINAGTVERVLTQHLSAGRIAGVHHGLECKEKVLAETGPRHRIVVVGYAPAAAANLKKGDEILTVGNLPVSNSFDLERVLWDKRPGQKVDVKVVRGGQEVTVQLTLLPGQSGSVAQNSNATRPEAATGLRAVADRNK